MPKDFKNKNLMISLIFLLIIVLVLFIFMSFFTVFDSSKLIKKSDLIVRGSMGRGYGGRCGEGWISFVPSKIYKGNIYGEQKQEMTIKTSDFHCWGYDMGSMLIFLQGPDTDGEYTITDGVNGIYLDNCFRRPENSPDCNVWLLKDYSNRGLLNNIAFTWDDFFHPLSEDMLLKIKNSHSTIELAQKLGLQ